MSAPAERKRRRLRRPSPALVVALLALFVALSGTAVAAGIVPLAKRALVSDNAGKLQGLAAWQVAALASHATVDVTTTPWSLVGNDEGDFSAVCPAGERAISGGYDNPVGDALASDSRPSPDGQSWVTYFSNLSPTSDASGTVYTVCLR